MNRLLFSDFDEFASAIRDVDLDVCLLDQHPQRCMWSLQEVELQSLRIQLAVEGSGMLAFGKMHQDGCGLYAQLSGAPISVNGQNIGPGAFAVLPPNAEFAFAGRGPVSWFSIFVPRQLLAGDAEPLSGRTSVFVPQGQSRLFRRLYSQVRKSFRYAAQLDLTSGRPPEIFNVQDNLLSSICEILSNDEMPFSEGSTPNSRRLAAQAVELIRSHQDSTLSVRSLAASLDVSERTLLNAFRDQVDVSPQAFLIKYRLHQARKDLLSDDPEKTSVATVAVRNGFFDFGRFATKYHQLFAEYPSETLRRPKMPKQWDAGVVAEDC